MQGTPTPIPIPPGQIVQIVDQVTEGMKGFQELGVSQGSLFVLGLAFVALIVYFLVTRNKGKELGIAMQTMSQVITNQQTDIQKAQQSADRLDEKYIQSFITIGEALNRIADNGKQQSDLLDAIHKTENSQDNLLSQVKNTIDGIVKDGSPPLQALAEDVKTIMAYFQVIDEPKGNWEKIIKIVPEIQTGLTTINQRLDELVNHARVEKKRSSQQVPSIEVVAGESIEVQAVQE
jgi:F0F1-type ATP synthase membrane subunit b/b'